MLISRKHLELDISAVEPAQVCSASVLLHNAALFPYFCSASPSRLNYKNLFIINQKIFYMF